MILDTSALIAVLRREPDRDRMIERLLAAADVGISAGTLIETRIVAVDARQGELAFEGFRRFGKGRRVAGLDFGDLFAYALARALDEPLLVKGAGFVQTDVKAA